MFKAYTDDNINQFESIVSKMKPRDLDNNKNKNKRNIIEKLLLKSRNNTDKYLEIILKYGIRIFNEFDLTYDWETEKGKKTL